MSAVGYVCVDLRDITLTDHLRYQSSELGRSAPFYTFTSSPTLRYGTTGPFIYPNTQEVSLQQLKSLNHSQVIHWLAS